MKYHLAESLRRQRASVMPFVVISLPVILAFLAIAIDFTRNVTTVRRLQFAADAAGLYMASFMTNADGSYDPNAAMANMLSALQDVNGQSGSGLAWNTAPAGQATSVASTLTDVVISGTDVSQVSNPADASEIFVQVTARRAGNDALQQFIAPAVWDLAALTGQGNPVAKTVAPWRITEIVGQPASRVGAAQPWAQAQTSLRNLAPFAVFPFAISNAQFAAASAVKNNSAIYTCDVVTPSNVKARASANHIKGCFVNDASGNTSGQAYGPGQGNAAIDQLTGLFKYFYPKVSIGAVLPSAVERGGRLPVFNPLDATFKSRESQVLAGLTSLTQNPWLILPVLNSDPSFTSTNQVVGFAYMKFLGANVRRSRMSLMFQIGPSVPLRNVTANNWSTVPTFTGAVLPVPAAPFTPRFYNPVDNSVSVRPSGVVLAAAVSPRKVSP